MNVKLTAITQPLIKTEDESRYLTPEEYIVYCARVSNPSNQLNTATASKLLNYCIKHKHWSIYEQVDMTVEIQTSRAIAAQILRHKSASFQEFSQRYAVAQSFENVELRKQGKTNRQVGDEEFDPLVKGGVRGCHASEMIEDHIDQCVDLYNKLIGEGVAKECARMILPMCTQTTLYMKNNIRNWIFYIELRTSQDTQKEHRDVALEIKKIFVENFPEISVALGWKE